MMNLLARGAGQRNLQALKAAAENAVPAPPGSAPPASRPVLAAATTAAQQPASARPPAQAPAAVDAWFHAPELLDPATSPMPWLHLGDHAAKALHCFDPAGRLERWPQKLSVQRLAMWVLWTRFDARRVYAEDEVNRVLKAWHLYGDHATLRRELVNHRLMTRKSDCSAYRKAALQPDEDVQALLTALRRRQAPLVRQESA